MPDHDCAVVCSVARIRFKDERALFAQPVVLLLVYKSLVSPVVSHIQATVFLVGVEVVSFAAFFHHREPIVGQGAKMIALLGCSSRGLLYRCTPPVTKGQQVHNHFAFIVASMRR